MEARPHPQDALALLHRRWQRPRGDDTVRIGKIFEQEMPRLRFRVPDGFKAVRDEVRRRDGGDVPVERDLLAARVPTANCRYCWRPVLRITEPGASAAAPSYVRRSRTMRERSFARELSTTTLQTRPWTSAPDRRSAWVRCWASAALGKGSMAVGGLLFAGDEIGGVDDAFVPGAVGECRLAAEIPCERTESL